VTSTETVLRAVATAERRRRWRRLAACLAATFILAFQPVATWPASPVDDAWNIHGLGKNYTLDDLVPGRGLPDAAPADANAPATTAEDEQRMGSYEGRPFLSRRADDGAETALGPPPHADSSAQVGSSTLASSPQHATYPGADGAGDTGTYRASDRDYDSYGAPRPPYPSNPPLPPAAAVPPNQPLPRNYQPWFVEPGSDEEGYDFYGTPPEQSYPSYGGAREPRDDADYDRDLDYEED